MQKQDALQEEIQVEMKRRKSSEDFSIWNISIKILFNHLENIIPFLKDLNINN